MTIMWLCRYELHDTSHAQLLDGHDIQARPTYNVNGPAVDVGPCNTGRYPIERAAVKGRD